MAGTRCIVIGVGNPDRGDDAAGRMAARRLQDMSPAGVEVVEEDGEATSLLARFDGADRALLIDACVSGTEPGTVHRFDVSGERLPQGHFGLSTHGFGLSEAVELARALGQLPRRCVVYAIEVASVEPGDDLSPEVAAAIDEVAERISAELDDDKMKGGGDA